jgi:RimJ/RimL family protein N-acetyltransferase
MSFHIRPLQIASPEDVLKIHGIFMHAIDKDSPLNGYVHGCPERCGECEQCRISKERVAALLTHPSSYVWEVWAEAPVDLIGILVLSKVDPGRDATAVYTFFDGKLRDKTEVLQWWINWAFQALALQRLSIEIPSYAFAALRHAKKLGFGGPFAFQEFPVEGIKRGALEYGDRQADLILMGMTHNAS